MFLGSLSLYHGLGVAVKLFQKLRLYKNIKFIIFGGGAARKELEKYINEYKLDNVILRSLPEREKMAPCINIADVCLVFVKESKFSRWLLSAKIFNYMACAKPIVGIASGETKRFIEKCKCGYIFDDEEDMDKLVNVILKISEDKSAAIKLGENGRQCVLREYSWEKIGERYADLIGSINI